MKHLFLLFFVIIAPFLGAQQNTKFMVSSDTHIFSPHSNFKETILYELTLAAIDEQADFIFFSGDLVVRSFYTAADEDSVLKDWRFVLDTLAVHGIRVYACRGNNERSKAAWDSLFKGEYAFPQNGPQNEKNITYALEFNDILFLSLDQYTNYMRINQTWLDSILNHNQKPHIFAAGHEPAFKLLHSGMSIYPAARDSLWESLLSAGAKIYFCGHDHFYDHAVIDDGGGSQQNDMHQVIVGTGSYFHSDSEYNGNNGRWTPVRLFHEHANGYVLVETMGDEVQMTWKHRTENGIYEDGGDSYSFSASGLSGKSAPVSGFALNQNYPNPFNNSTVISYQLPVFSDVELSIYNIYGQKVKTLVSETQPAGSYQAEWDAAPASGGQGFASGIYFCRLEADRRYVKTRKLVLLK